MQYTPYLRVLRAAALAVACSALHASPATSQSLPPTPATASLAGQQAGEPPRPGDVIRVRVWREPDLSGDFQVDASGQAVLPRLGSVRVGDFTADSLRRNLVAVYSQHLLEPSVEVRLLRRIAVAGAVRSPGVLNVDETMTVANVLTMAGGPTPEGSKSHVVLIRGDQRVSDNIRRDAVIGNSLVRSGDQLFVPEKGWFSRNAALVASVVGTAGFVTAALIARSR